jgi:hypothetical protein
MPRRVRASTTDRDYGVRHKRTCEYWRPFVRAGLVTCPVCGERIDPREPWHLGHSDDRQTYIGPTHKICNLREAGLKTARLRRGEQRVTSRQW